MLRTDLAVVAVFLSLATAGCSGGAESQEAPPPPKSRGCRDCLLRQRDRGLGRFRRPVRGPPECRREASSYRLSRVGPTSGTANMSAAASSSSPSTRARRRPSSTRHGRNLVRAQAQAVNARTDSPARAPSPAQRAASVEEVEQRQAALRSANADVSRRGSAARAVSSMSASLGSSRRSRGRFPSGGRPRQRCHRRPDGADDRRLDEPAAFRLRRIGGLAAPLPAPGWLARIGAPVRIRLQDEAQICPRRPARLRRQCR